MSFQTPCLVILKIAAAPPGLHVPPSTASTARKYACRASIPSNLVTLSNSVTYHPFQFSFTSHPTTTSAGVALRAASRHDIGGSYRSLIGQFPLPRTKTTAGLALRWVCCGSRAADPSTCPRPTYQARPPECMLRIASPPHHQP